jgi:GT2 family glycosyltransferase
VNGDAPILSLVVAVSDHGEPLDVLAALERQTLAPDRWELVVADSEPRADWEAAVARRGAPARTLYLRTPRAAGRAGANNRGIREARGRIVVLLADDFVPEEGFLAEHLAFHDADRRPQAVGIGPALFPEEVRGDPFPRWLEDTGHLFGFSFTDATAQLPPDFFYAGNASLKREFLLAGRLFDERLARHAVDDFELGRRLRERGMEAAYVRGARAWHHHPLTLEERVRVTREAGRSVALLDAIYPAPHAWNSGTDPTAPTGLMWLDGQRHRLRHRLGGGERARARYFERTLRRAFVRGYREAARAGGARAPRTIPRLDSPPAAG